MKLHRSLNTMQDIEDWIQSSDEEIENPKDSIEIVEKEQEKGAIAPIYSMYPRKRFREESIEEIKWIQERIDKIPLSEAEKALITKEMIERLDKQPRNEVESRDLIQEFMLLRSAIKRLPPQQIDLTSTFKGQGLCGSCEAFVKRKNEGTLVPHIQKLFADKERYSLTDIRKLIHTECVKEKIDCVVVLKEGSCRLCEEKGIPLPRANSLYSRRRSSSYYLEDWIRQYLSTVNKRQKRLRVSTDEYDCGYVPSGTQSRDYDDCHNHEEY
jgi:hypothetical protein